MRTDIERDYVGWLEKQIKELRDRSFEQLDIDNLIEELEALVRNEKAAVESFAYQIMLHFLLIDFWTEEKRTRGHWRGEVDNFQFQLNRKLTTNLKNSLERQLDNIYAKSRRTAVRKTGLPSDRFPVDCPYTLEQILDDES